MLSGEFAGGLGYGRRSVLVIFIVVLLFSAGNYLFNGFYAGMKYKGGDFLNYYANGKLLINGIDIHDDEVRENAVRTMGIYGEDDLIKKQHEADYPPFWYLVMSILTVVNWRAAFYLWTLINQLFLIGAIYFLFRYFRVKLWSLEAALILFIILNYYPLYYNLMEGQVNIFLLFLVAWSLWLFKNGCDWGAGLLLGLATGIKILPGLLLFYFLWKGHWKVVIFGVVGALGTALITIFGAGLDVLSSYISVQLPKYGMVPRPLVFNQSINGFISRLLTHSDSSNGWVNSPLTANLLIRISSLIVLITSLIITRGRFGRGRLSWDLGFGIFILAMMLTSATTVEHHYVFLYIPYMVILLGNIRDEGIGAVSAVITVCCFALIAFFIPYTSPKFNSGILILIKSLKFYPLMLMWIMLCWDLRRVKQSARA